MIGDYTIMDWATFGGVLATILAILTTFIQLYRDNRSLLSEIESLSKDNERLSNQLSQERLLLSKENESIKHDTQYISDEMKIEKMARESLYKNSSRAKEILETMDMMKEVVLQNAKLNQKVAYLEAEQEVTRKSNETEVATLIQILGRIEGQLSSLENYKEVEHIHSVLNTIKTELLTYKK